jgi:hypothetical protein
MAPRPQGETTGIAAARSQPAELLIEPSPSSYSSTSSRQARNPSCIASATPYSRWL